MVDFLDIAIASSLNKGGSPDASAKKAQRAAASAEKAVENVNKTINDIKQDAATAIETANMAAVQASEAAERAEQASQEMSSVDIATEIATDAIVTTIQSGSKKATLKRYKSNGANEDGTMTQKAITQYVDTKAAEVEAKIPTEGGASGSIDLGGENAGSFVSVNDNGNPHASDITEDSVILTQIVSGTYRAKDAVGIRINYANKTFSRIQNATGLNAGVDFSNLSIYKNIKRCIVNDEGAIIAFDNEMAFIDNINSGYQTMVFIPKFYYMRMPITLEGNNIIEEVIIISPKEQAGFKLHPAFINENGEEVEYFLYPAYEGSTYSIANQAYNLRDEAVNFNADLLSSVPGAKPISGRNNILNADSAEKLANNRGQGWHITSIKAESVLQMLFIIEFGTLNAQNALEVGISDLPSGSIENGASITGSTSVLKHETGFATATVNEVGGVETIYTEAGKRAISYRGIENPWGNIWRIVGGINIRGTGNDKGGVPYVCDSLDYKNGTYVDANFMLPNQSNWISNFGYGRESTDWLFMPVESARNADSSLPVGDYIWISVNLNGTNGVVMGGNWAFGTYNGLFYYGCDHNTQFSGRAYSVRLMYVPIKNQAYENNLIKIGG